MEILILLLVVAVGFFLYMNKKAINESTPTTAYPTVDLNTPPEKDAYTPVEATPSPVEVAQEQPVKKARKPRTPKTEPVKKAASKKPADTKATVAKGRKPRSKTA